MTRSGWAAGLLLLLGLGTLVLGAMTLMAGHSQYDGFALLSFAILATGCLCTGAVLWARGHERP